MFALATTPEGTIIPPTYEIEQLTAVIQDSVSDNTAAQYIQQIIRADANGIDFSNWADIEMWSATLTPSVARIYRAAVTKVFERMHTAAELTIPADDIRSNLILGNLKNKIDVRMREMAKSDNDGDTQERPRIWLPDAKIDELFTQFLNKDTLHGHNTYLLFRVALATGARCSELSNLTFDCFTYEGDKAYCFILNGKGGRDRAIPIRESDIKAVREWQNAIDQEIQRIKSIKPRDSKHARRIALQIHDLESSDRVFRACERTMSDSMSQKTIERTVTRIGILLGYGSDLTEKELKPHSLRRTFAELVYRATGKDIVATSRLLGHKNIETTMKYLRVEVNSDFIGKMPSFDLS